MDSTTSSIEYVEIAPVIDEALKTRLDRISRFATQRPDGEVTTSGSDWTKYAPHYSDSTKPGPRVIVRGVVGEASRGLLDKEVVLQAIDTNDSRLTFFVAVDPEVWNEVFSVNVTKPQHTWVYDVEDATHAKTRLQNEERPAEEPEPSETKTPIVDYSEYVSLQQRLTEAQASLGAARTDVEQARTNASRIRGEFEGFKEQVRDKAIEVAEEQGWCDDGLNEVLRDLGLPEKTKPRVRFTVVVEVEMEATLTGDDDSASFIEGCLSADSDGEVHHDSDLDDVDWNDATIVRVKDVETID